MRSLRVMKLVWSWLGRISVSLFVVGSMGWSHAGQEIQDSDSKTASIDAKTVGMDESLKRPLWLTDLSVTARETYDSNVFATNADRPGFPQIANVGSWVTSIMPKIGVNFAPLLDLSPTVEAFSLSYSPEVVRYHEAATENYEAHRVATQIKGKEDSFSYCFDNQLTFIDGDRNTPQYNQVSAFATAFVRERRDQIQDRSKLVLRQDWDHYFVRGVGTFLGYDMNTYQLNPTGRYAGWQDYEDRYDVNGGVDFGYKVTSDFAATVGYRHGHQYQQAFSWVGLDSTNDYDRILGGVEGKPWQWLKIELQAGPDFHQYDMQEMQTGHASELTRFYLDGLVTMELSHRDSLNFTVKQWQWVSSVGTTSYEDKTFSVLYTHKWLDAFSTNVGYQILGAVYDAPTVRSDWQYTYSAGLKYDLNEHLSFAADYSFSQGVNDSDIPELAPGREYDRHLVTLSARAMF